MADEDRAAEGHEAWGRRGWSAGRRMGESPGGARKPGEARANAGRRAGATGPRLAGRLMRGQ